MPEYEVKWKGYDATTWEPEENLTHCSDIVAQFEDHLIQDNPVKLIQVHLAHLSRRLQSASASLERAKGELHRLLGRDSRVLKDPTLRHDFERQITELHTLTAIKNFVKNLLRKPDEAFAAELAYHKQASVEADR